MFDIGWTELLLIGIVALIVVGPKDLPGLFRNLGRFVGRMRGMAREFQRAMEQAADESGVKDMAREFRDSASGKDFGADELRSLAKGPKHWAKNAARKSVVGEDGTAKPAVKPAAGTPVASKPAAGTDAPRGPATEALARDRAAEAEALRAARATPASPPAADAQPPAGAPSASGSERDGQTSGGAA